MHTILGSPVAHVPACLLQQMSSVDGSDESIVNDKSDARRQFLLRWTCTLQFISRELTNTSAPSFGQCRCCDDQSLNNVHV